MEQGGGGGDKYMRDTDMCVLSVNEENSEQVGSKRKAKIKWKELMEGNSWGDHI